MHRRTIVFACLLFSLTLSLAGCGGEKIESRWRDREITIDGDASEWRGTEQYSDDDKGVRFAVFNDGEFLYMCLSTWNTKTQQQILVRGLTFWFDAEGGKKKNYGLEYPLKKNPGEIKALREMRDTASQERAKAIAELVVESGSELAAGRTEKSEGLWMFVQDAREMGIEAALEMDDRILVIELRVPLTGGELRPFPEGLTEGGTAGLGIEMGKMDLGAMREQRPEMPQNGGSGRGRGGGGGKRGGGGGGGMRRTMEEEIEVWTKVTLAIEK